MQHMHHIVLGKRDQIPRMEEAGLAGAFLHILSHALLKSSLFPGAGSVYHSTVNGADSVIPIDLYVPGCPPHPATLLNALLRFIGSGKTADFS